MASKSLSSGSSPAQDVRSEPLKFVPFRSFVNASFWHKLAEIKLNVDRLRTESRPISGFFNNSNAVQTWLELDCTAFNASPNPAKPCIHPSFGSLINLNTMEDFRATDKAALLNDHSARLWQRILSGDCVRNPTLLSTFLLLTFADIKKHLFHYWFAFPTIARSVATCQSNQTIAEYFAATANHIDLIYSAYATIEDADQRTYFVLKAIRSASQVTAYEHRTLASLINTSNLAENFADGAEDFLFAYADPSSTEHAGWPSRMFLVMLLALCPRLSGKTIRLLAIRCKNIVSLEPSRVFVVRFDDDGLDVSPTANWQTYLGWEPNDQHKLTSRCADMASSMAPEKLAETSVSLNLKLMKWRVMPTLDLDRISSTKCLLMGAGTLGCSVARNLLSWGIRHITLVDNGTVSYSNPVRQSLFVFEDAQKNLPKAPLAASRLSQICPGLDITGHCMHIPMPGHPVSSSPEQQRIIHSAIDSLDALIREHDAVFLLTDSRESRWLPTMLGATYDKIVINAALGFDSYLVMRHGTRKPPIASAADAPNGLRQISGSQLGCYFCNDITAPGNSLKDRTLDQQCTVTRPGVSSIAGALAVELLIALLQHEHRELAPAYVACRTADAPDECLNSDEAHRRRRVPESLLGIIPHSIRGILSSYEQILPATERYGQCIACSQPVLAEYQANGHEFLFEVLNSSKYLEELTGIDTAFQMPDEDELQEMPGSDDDDNDA